MGRQSVIASGGTERMDAATRAARLKTIMGRLEMVWWKRNGRGGGR